jgi:hypothetical protein
LWRECLRTSKPSCFPMACAMDLSEGEYDTPMYP